MGWWNEKAGLYPVVRRPATEPTINLQELAERNGSPELRLLYLRQCESTSRDGRYRCLNVAARNGLCGRCNEGWRRARG